jgi:opacity protein-like surface antigen
MKSTLAPAMLALALASVRPVDAQTAIPPFEVSPFAGYLFGGSVFHDSQGAPFSRIVVADHFTFGVRVGFNATSRFEPELQWSRTDTEMNFDQEDLGPHIPLTIDYFLAGASYNFSAGRIRPYVSVGLGAARLQDVRVTARGIRPATNFAGSLGVGIKAFLTPNVGLRFDARGYASQILGRDFFIRCKKPSEGGAIAPVPCGDHWLWNGDLTGGLVFAF